MYKVGITGGIGSGKSSVCALFAAYGVPVYDCDGEAKRLMEQSAELRDALCEAFGAECYNESGLNRAYLAAKVFGEEEKNADFKRVYADVHDRRIAERGSERVHDFARTEFVVA